MLAILTYDISDTTMRSRFIKRLYHYGLKRAQKSVFIGYLQPNEIFDLSEEFNSYLSSPKDSIALFPLCESCKKSIVNEGNISIPQNNESYRFI